MSVIASADPIRLDSENPHYFYFRGKPTVLITSGEHYGAVLNLDFDYAKYLDTLAADGLNNTRLFTGEYMEPDGAFKITRNTLAPAPSRLICPWARSDVPGYANGGDKFDLDRWDGAYFARLKDFVSMASDRGVVVEVNLFCPFYGDEQWRLSPLNAANNVNGVGDVPREDVYTLDRSGGLLAVQDAMPRKIVTELRDFDNIYYEIMNEPYVRHVPDDWQRHIADVIVETEKSFPHHHLISQNIANGRAKVTNPNPDVSIFNFHYATPPDTVEMNYGLNRVIGDNETGFKGNADTTYRKEGWEFILAGGALYNNLDYSFTVGHEDGTFAYPSTQPGGGSVALRHQLHVLSEFINSFDFIRMAPHQDALAGGLSDGTEARVLAEPGKQYAIYVHRDGKGDQRAPLSLRLHLPTGTYQAEWIDVLNGETARTDQLESRGGEQELTSPPFTTDIALRIR